MISYSIIQKSQLEGALRLDAEYYRPEYLEIRKNIESISFSDFKEIIISFGSGKNLPQSNNNKSTKFIRTQNVRPIIIDKNGISFTEEKNCPKLDYGDLLFVRVGEGVGDNSVVTRGFCNSTFSDNVIRIKIKKVNPFYISVLLNSRIGSLLMEQIKKGSARPLISRENLDSLKIPAIPEKEQFYFENIVNQAEELIEESETIYSQAENLLLEELGLADFKEADELFSIVKLSDIKSAERMDAEYFQPKYEKLTSRVKKRNGKLLGDLVSIKKGIEPGAEEYQEKGKLFIRVSSLSKQGIIDKDQKYLSDELYRKLKNDFEPKVGEILLTKDATPGIARVLKEPVEGIIAGGVLRLKTKIDIEPEYLALVVNSIIGQAQAERDAGGSVIAHWKPEQIRNMLIPILPKPTQQKIASLVKKSHQARKKAKELLDEAKAKVEALIEK